MEGISDEIIEVGTPLTLTCKVHRIKPEAAEMYWIVNGRTENGAIISTTYVDGTISQMNVLQYM